MADIVCGPLCYFVITPIRRRRLRDLVTLICNLLKIVCVFILGCDTVNGPCLLDYLILKLRLPVVLYVSFAVDS